jgi:hypothetical protein
VNLVHDLTNFVDGVDHRHLDDSGNGTRKGYGHIPLLNPPVLGVPGRVLSGVDSETMHAVRVGAPFADLVDGEGRDVLPQCVRDGEPSSQVPKMTANSRFSSRVSIPTALRSS